MSLKENYMVEKRNILNEIRANGMSLQELRLFSIYLSKINARDLSTRVVRLPLTDFQRIMELGKLNLAFLKNAVSQLMSKVVSVPLETGGFKMFQLFKEGLCTQDENGEWYVEIDAHDQALPLMFQFKERYFTYKLWNALRLKSSNQLRMYEILKQYEHIGERVVSVKELKELLGIGPKEYSRYGDFKNHVLDVCQKALEENTDIKYTYEPAGKKGKGGKILNIKFWIWKNFGHRDSISLSEFIANMERNAAEAREQGIVISDEEREAARKAVLEGESEVIALDNNYFTSDIFPFLSQACRDEFSEAEIQVLYNIAINVIPYIFTGLDAYRLELFDYFKAKYDELRRRALRSDLEPIKSRFDYIKKIMKAELEGR